MRHLSFSGVFPILKTPFNEKEEIVHDDVRKETECKCPLSCLALALPPRSIPPGGTTRQPSEHPRREHYHLQRALPQSAGNCLFAVHPRLCQRSKVFLFLSFFSVPLFPARSRCLSLSFFSSFLSFITWVLSVALFPSLLSILRPATQAREKSIVQRGIGHPGTNV